MSAHYIWISCAKCDVTDSIYTGDIDPDNFTNGNWEGGTITSVCDECIRGNR